MIVVAGGVHGDEPSGALLLPRLAADGFRALGPLNPWGLERGRRWLADGGDLNRLLASRRCPEARRARELLAEEPPQLLLDLHEDRDSDRPYLIQVDPEGDLGSRVVAALSSRWAFHPTPRFGPVLGRRGVIRPRRWMLWLQRLSRRWSLTFYAWHRHGCPAYVVEVPSHWPLDERLEFHLSVCRAVRAAQAA